MDNFSWNFFYSQIAQNLAYFLRLLFKKVSLFIQKVDEIVEVGRENCITFLVHNRHDFIFEAFFS